MSIKPKRCLLPVERWYKSLVYENSITGSNLSIADYDRAIDYLDTEEDAKDNLPLNQERIGVPN